MTYPQMSAHLLTASLLYKLVVVVVVCCAELLEKAEIKHKKHPEPVDNLGITCG